MESGTGEYGGGAEKGNEAGGRRKAGGFERGRRLTIYTLFSIPCVFISILSILLALQPVLSTSLRCCVRGLARTFPSLSFFLFPFSLFHLLALFSCIVTFNMSTAQELTDRLIVAAEEQDVLYVLHWIDEMKRQKCLDEAINGKREFLFSSMRELYLITSHRQIRGKATQQSEQSFSLPSLDFASSSSRFYSWKVQMRTQG